jgi:two-component system, cell cycle sensor histidine kinase and response regulator CckA
LRYDTNIPLASREKLTIIQQQVQRAASLIRQILDFSRRSIMDPSDLDLLPFIKELDKLLGRVLPETIRLSLKYQPTSYWVNADPTRLQQIFMNLALNARDAMPEGGILHFELNRFHLNPGSARPFPSMPAGDWIRIAVTDTGIGISPEVREHIFEPFFTTKPAGQGTGLGLAQVYGIVKQHDGYIDVQSGEGKGTSFIIYLPALAMPEPVEAPNEPQSKVDGYGETVLVVEDDRATREAIQALLEAQNYIVLTAANGAEALSYCEQSGIPISLVISDIVMPHMGGMALHRTLQERWPNIKILFVTGHPMENENQALLEKGNVHWLQKPFSIREFNQAVSALSIGE